jgi:hypothetical protein
MCFPKEEILPQVEEFLFEMTAFLGKESRRKNNNCKSGSFQDCSSHNQDRIWSIMPLYYGNLLLRCDSGVRVRALILPYAVVRDDKKKALGCQVEQQLIIEPEHDPLCRSEIGLIIMGIVHWL